MHMTPTQMYIFPIVMQSGTVVLVPAVHNTLNMQIQLSSAHCQHHIIQSVTSAQPEGMQKLYVPAACGPKDEQLKPRCNSSPAESASCYSQGSLPQPDVWRICMFQRH